jgi:hypothetical protein
MIPVEVRLHMSLERIRPGLRIGNPFLVKLEEGRTVERMDRDLVTRASDQLGATLLSWTV